jgi:hypothetical protein
VKLDWAAPSNGPKLHANTWPPASTFQPSFLFRVSSSKTFSGWYKVFNCSTSTPPYAGWAQDSVLLFVYRLPPKFPLSVRLGKELFLSGRPILNANTWSTPLPFLYPVPITTELLLCFWILLKPKHYQLLWCHMRLDGAASSAVLTYMLKRDPRSTIQT